MKTSNNLKIISALLISWFLLPAVSWADSSRDISFSSTCDQSGQNAVLSFVGDILVHGAIYNKVVEQSKDFSQVWRRTNSLIQKADFSAGNLEGPTAMGVDRKGVDHGEIGFVHDGKIFSGSNFSFNFHPRILGDLKKSGYDLLTMANNHTLDRRSLGVDKTIQAARAAGMPFVGIRHSQERNADFHYIADVKGLRIAYLGCTEATNGHEDTKDQLLFCYKDEGRILSIIRDLASRSDVDAVIVMPHWGREYKHVPHSSQQKYARLYLEAGATAVVGSHPHVLQPWEKYTTKDGRETLIAYSLGNFVAGQAGIERKASAVLYIGLKRQSGGGHITGVAYAPTIRDGFEVYPVGNERSDVIRHVRQFFGDKARITPQDEVLRTICRKKATD